MLTENKPYSSRGVIIADRVQLHPALDAARFILRINAAKIKLAEKALGATIPLQIGALLKTDPISVACIGPDEWYILADAEQSDAIIQAFKALYEKEPHSLVDVSHRETGIEITGPQAEWLLNAASPLDLSQMNAPGAARTVFDHAQIILIKWDDEHYRIEVWNSFADHVWTLLETISHEV